MEWERGGHEHAILGEKMGKYKARNNSEMVGGDREITAEVLTPPL